MKWHVFFFVCLAFLTKGLAQTCTIQPSSYKVCLGNSVVFGISTTGTIAGVKWNYGDGGTDTIITGTHLYKTPGTYYVNVVVRFTNNTTCTATVTAPIKVFDLPKANFTMNADTICMSVPLCVNNTSMLSSSGAPLRKSTFLFGDGAILYNQNSPCHSYTRTGNFIVTLEIEDTNGCISRIEKPVVVIDFNVYMIAKEIACGQIQFINAGGFPFKNVKRFYWDFGDGTFDSSTVKYDSVVHKFTNINKCPFNVKLFIQTTNGCVGTYTLSVCPLYKFNIGLTSDREKMCFRDNIFNFSNPYNLSALMVWRYKEEGTNLWQGTVYGSAAKYSFLRCGRFIVSLQIIPFGLYNNKCDTTLFDTVDVLGPQSIIEKDTVAPFKVINHYMCNPDTAYFVSPTMYQSRHCAASVKRLWDFGDLNCPQCTTDTKKGINVNTNCRWSKDSANVKHRYLRDSCYGVHLVLWDTITGCIDSDFIKVVVGKPDLSKIKIKGNPCVGAVQYVDLENVRPSCETEGFWFNKDTICLGNRIGSWLKLPKQNFSYTINSLCGGNKSVTGFVLKNGNCYDTFYFPRTYPKLHPRFDVIGNSNCAPFVAQTAIFDSVQPLCYRAVWDWNDGSAPTIDSPVINGFVKSQTHTFNRNGLYRIKLTLYDSSPGNTGCVFDTVFNLTVGFHMSLGINSFLCNGYVNFSQSVKFFSNPFTPSTPYLPFYGKITYYYGDGTVDTILSSHKYTKAGQYHIKIVARDTLGCIDSVEGDVKVNVFHVGFTHIPKILVCGQIVQFSDSSFVIDSSGVNPRDSIVSWLWDFGDQRATSTLKNPAHAYFVNGTFEVKLIVTTWKGCIDSVIIPIFIKGPYPKFELITDTIGCAPYTIKLRNLSTDCDQTIVYMGDPNNTSFLLKKTDTLTYTYTQPGIYYLYMFGEASFVNPNTGSNVYCNAWYPDKSNPDARVIQVIVLAKPPSKFTAPDTVCVNAVFDITNSSDKRYDTYNWDFGDGITDLKWRPDTNIQHSYLAKGTYTITLAPVYTPWAGDIACPDTFRKKIVVVEVEPAFTMDVSGMPVVKFINTSKYAHSYLWDFGHPESGNLNESKLVNPEHDFYNDTGIHVICLTAFSNFGCFDSVCQLIRNDNYKSLIIPNVFTINNDGMNDAFDIDIHGEIYYDLTIYNRWGDEVYQSKIDGEGNDKINWNGKVSNTGAELPSGEYYYKFNYQFRGEEVKVTKGIVTLIR